jgi:predicted O-methyltransferase YrrM
MDLYYARKKLRSLVKPLVGRPQYPARYQQIYDLIDERKPKAILEIGTNDGLNAGRMMKRALRFHRDAAYYGFDLFEYQTEESYLREIALRVPSRSRVEEYLRSLGLRNIHLYAGDTTKTLVDADIPKMNLIFIDGGHSFETVTADWRNVERLVGDETVILFDDYPNWGIGPVVDSIDRSHWSVEILPVRDHFRAIDDKGQLEAEKRAFQLAKVMKAS